MTLSKSPLSASQPKKTLFWLQIFTAAPPLVLGLFDRYCSAESMVRFPQLYKQSQNSELFNVKIFWMWIANSVYHSILLFWMPVLVMYHGQYPPYCCSVLVCTFERQYYNCVFWFLFQTLSGQMVKPAIIYF